MKNDILDAINEATQQGKAVHSIRVNSPELWKQIHEDDYLRGFLTRTPGGLPAFAGVVMHYQASDSAAGFELEFD